MTPLTATSSSSDWKFPRIIRQNLTKLLIMHVVGAFFTFVVFVMAVVAHFHSPSHSSCYLLTHLITTIVTFLISLAALIIDILLFSPHLAFGTWFTLAATIILLIASIAVGVNRSMTSKNRLLVFFL